MFADNETACSPTLPHFDPASYYDDIIHLWYSRSSSSSSSSSSVICQTKGPKPLPKRFLHIVRSRASSFNWQYPLLSLRSSSSFLRLLPRLLVTSICPFFFPSITCCRRQFLRKMWPIQLAFRFIISCLSFFKKNIYVTRGTCTWGAEKSLARPGRKQGNVYLDSLVTLLIGFPVLTSCTKLVVI